METEINNGLTNKTRPSTLEEVVGMDHVKRIIKYDILGCRALGDPLASYIIAGPPGTGKSTIAEIIASLSKRSDGSNAEIIKRLGSDIKSPEQLYEIAATSKDGDVVYLEEAHSIGGSSNKSKICQAILLEWIENFRILGGAEYDLLTAPKVCFVLPTTNPGYLSYALRTRCKILHTSYYHIDEMKEILVRAARRVGLNLESDPKALSILAQCSRGTPRIAIMHRLDTLRKVMAVDQLEYNLETVKHCLRINSIDEWGLEPNDRRYCQLLYDKTILSGGKPVGRKTMVQCTGLSEDMLDTMIEAYLQQIGAIRIDNRGRVLTELGYELIGQPPLLTDPIDKIKINNIKLDDLKEILKADNIRKLGMKHLMGQFGLKYGRDNGIMQSALKRCGYIAKKRIGIVPIEFDLNNKEIINDNDEYSE